MQTTLLWSGHLYNSLEHCMLTSNGTEARAVIIGAYQDYLYKVQYTIKTNRHWETVWVELETQLNNKSTSTILNSDGKGNWVKNGKPAPAFKNCIDIDISLTPFTNTLPVNRLHLAVQESRQIKVLFFDILDRKIKPVHQRYTRVSETQYRFENVPNDFEAVITVDESGFVVDYPGLFVRQQIKQDR